MIYRPKILKVKFPKGLYGDFKNNNYTYKEYFNEFGYQLISELV